MRHGLRTGNSPFWRTGSDSEPSLNTSLSEEFLYCHFGENQAQNLADLLKDTKLHFDIKFHCFAFVKGKHFSPPELSILDLKEVVVSWFVYKN